jgi:hypothetical protein
MRPTALPGQEASKPIINTTIQTLPRPTPDRVETFRLGLGQIVLSLVDMAAKKKQEKTPAVSRRGFVRDLSDVRDQKLR